jgi:hypothetical protein
MEQTVGATSRIGAPPAAHSQGRHREMPTFTVVTELRESFHVSQHRAQSAELAVASHLASLPYDDGDEIEEEELAWRDRLITGSLAVELLEVHGCANTWMWTEGARHSPQYSTYVIQTEV